MVSGSGDRHEPRVYPRLLRPPPASYLDVLEDTPVAFRLPAWEARLRVRERRHPKLDWADPGLPRAIKRSFAPPVPEERGALLEGWVASVLRAYRDLRGLFDDWGWWAAGKGAESVVDFLLRKDDRLVALAVKAGRDVHERGLRGLDAVAGLAGMTRRAVVYPGERRRRTAGGIDVLPVTELLELVAGGALFDPAA